jgi:DNA-binding NtrC family response regulator
MSAKVKLVAIDDTPQILELISEALAEEDVEIHSTTDPEEGLDLILREHPQVVLLDLVMPKLNGMEVLERIVEFDPSIDVILMTAHYSTESAVEAIRKGASDYLNKPISVVSLRLRVGKILTDARRRLRTMQLDEELLQASQFEGIVGRSPLMWEMFAKIRRIAPHFRSVLVTGATGTGKDLVARALHRLSPAAAGHLVICNCSAVVETLFESELFGYVRGAFTGAAQDKMGLVEYANGGTLFLDEIGDMPLATQAKLLTVLQNQEVRRVGSLTARKVDIRVVAATHRDLPSLIGQKLFREDLYYRLAMVEISVPPLSERREDIPLLQRHFVERFATQYRKDIRGLTHRAQVLLARHDWPGNVRELENVIGHACMMAMSETIDVEDFPAKLRPTFAQLPEEPSSPVELDGSSLDEKERNLLAAALEQAGGNQSQAARLLRISRDRLRYKMAKFHLR